MKFLVHANGPHVSTGYGVQCAQLVEMLHRDGHQVAVSCTYGQQGAVGTWPVRNLPRSPENTVRLYPAGRHPEGGSSDVIHNHALQHFEGDDKGGWIVTLIDLWVLRDNPFLKDFNIAAWCPVDHFPVPPDVLRFFERTDAVPVAMTRFGERLLFNAGLDPVYVPLAVDTRVMKPTATYEDPAKGTVTGRQLMGVPEDAFVVGMVGMNKGNQRDRKGFNEALRAFGAFWQNHNDAVLYMHCDPSPIAGGVDLRELATHATVPPHAIHWVNEYAYWMGLSAQQMAAIYTGMDVLLAPSHGEGFCVPLIEAQACGTPVIATDFSAQPELVGAGWVVGGQPEWDPAQHASYVCPDIDEIVDRLERAYTLARDDTKREAAAGHAVEFAAQYDTQRVYDEYWRPFLATLEPAPAPVVEYDRSPIPEVDGVAVIVPAMRPENLPRLIESFEATNDGSATLVIAHDNGFAFNATDHVRIGMSVDRSTFAEKVNAAYRMTSEPWLLVVGDDVEFKPGWIEAARKVSGEFDVIGTNDTSGAVKNPEVAAGRHADHAFFRRAYVESEGASLDGPGVLMPEAYRHWYCDREVIELAKMRGVFTPCLSSVVEHLHPGYAGREDLREADAVYMAAVEHADKDRETFEARRPLIAMQRTSRAKVA